MIAWAISLIIGGAALFAAIKTLVEVYDWAKERWNRSVDVTIDETIDLAAQADEIDRKLDENVKK